MILVDSSAWIDFLRANGSPAHERIRQLIAEGAPLATTDPVVMEVLAGAADGARVVEVRRFLNHFDHLPTTGLADFEAAAGLYRRCRAGGATVRSLTDCLIAAVAIRNGVEILSSDRDFETLARHSALTLYAA